MRCNLRRCDMCGYEQRVAHHLFLHYLKHHSPFNFVLKCDQCGMETYNERRLWKHIHLLHMTPQKERRTVECDDCGKALQGQVKHQIFNHFLRRHTDVRSDYECAECDKYCFWSRDDTFRHLLAMHLPQLRQYRCSKCHLEFGGGAAIQRHRLRVHGGKKSHCVCDKCDRVFISPLTLGRHMISAHSNDSEELRCDHCGQRLSCRKYLWQHLFTKHITLPPIVKSVCDDCGEQVTKTDRLMFSHFIRRHVVSEIEADRMQCNACDWTTKFRTNLTEHVHLAHGGTEGVKCRVCGQKFNSLNVMQHHERVTHRGVRWICDCCDKVFVARPAMKNHMAAMHYLHCK